MIGPAIEAPGGMSAVVASYRQAGFFDRWHVRYIATYRHPDWPSKIWQLLVSTSRFLSLLLRRRVALLHVHAASRGSFWRKCIFMALARLGRVPVILHIHSGEFGDFYQQECGPARQALVRWAMRGSAKVVCLTKQWQLRLGAIEPRAHFIHLPNPVDIQVDVPSSGVGRDARQRTVLFLGRLRERKGVFDLVKAWPAVRSACPGARLVLAGDGDQTPVKALAVQLGVADSIEFPGWVMGEAKARHLAGSSVFVLPSYAEGLPVCILEAMAHGLVIVTTDVGGIPEVVRDGCEAILIRPGDVDGLARALVTALCDEGLAQRLGDAARKRVVGTYSMSLVLGRLDDLYREQLDGSAAHETVS